MPTYEPPKTPVLIITSGMEVEVIRDALSGW